jgi:hypothetical protein
VNTSEIFMVARPVTQTAEVAIKKASIHEIGKMVALGNFKKQAPAIITNKKDIANNLAGFIE